MRYAGRSVRRSAPGATAFGSGSPGSVTSSSGQGFGLRWQNRRKSYANSLGTMTRLAWTKPIASPGVGPWRVPARQAARTAAPVAYVRSIAGFVREKGRRRGFQRLEYVYREPAVPPRLP